MQATTKIEKTKTRNQKQSRSTKKPFVLKVDEDGEEQRNKRHCPAWGAVCSLCKIKKKHFKDSKECKRLQKQTKPKLGIKSSPDQLRNDLF